MNDSQPDWFLLSLEMPLCRSPLALFQFKIQLPQIKPQFGLQLLYTSFSGLNLQSSVVSVLQQSPFSGQKPLSWVACCFSFAEQAWGWQLVLKSRAEFRSVQVKLRSSLDTSRASKPEFKKCTASTISSMGCLRCTVPAQAPILGKSLYLNTCHLLSYWEHSSWAN